jgi:hypothetical protein
MAAINGEIVFKSGEYRPCITTTTDKRALFHRWVEEVGMTLALLEFEDGHLAKVNPKNIRFLDSRGMFSDICWNMGDEINKDEEERENEELKRFVHENL